MASQSQNVEVLQVTLPKSMVEALRGRVDRGEAKDISDAIAIMFADDAYDPLFGFPAGVNGDALEKHLRETIPQRIEAVQAGTAHLYSQQEVDVHLSKVLRDEAEAA